MQRIRSYVNAVEMLAHCRDKQLKELLAILIDADNGPQIVIDAVKSLMNVYEEDVRKLRDSYLSDLDELLNEETDSAIEQQLDKLKHLAANLAEDDESEKEQDETV